MKVDLQHQMAPDEGDGDPAECMPARGKCRYSREWVAVDIRLSLKVNTAEKRGPCELGHPGARIAS